MKGCLIAFVVVLIILMILVTAAVVVFFGFEKELPESFVQTIKDEIKGIGDATITVDYNFVNNFGDITSNVEYEIFNKEGTSTYYLKGTVERTGKDETLKLVAKGYDKEGSQTFYYRYYIEDGKYMYAESETGYEISEATWKNSIAERFVGALPLEAKEGGYKIIGGDVIENNLSKVTQKGMHITAYAYDGADEYCLSYNIGSMQMGEYHITKIGKESDYFGRMVVSYVCDLDLSKFM